MNEDRFTDEKGRTVTHDAFGRVRVPPMPQDIRPQLVYEMNEDQQKLWAEEYEEFYFEEEKPPKTMRHAVVWVIIAAIVMTLFFGGLLLLFLTI